MIVYIYNGIHFCYLVNPKCGTHTFYNFYYLFLRKYIEQIHFGNSELNNLEYSNYNYYHCNLEGALKFFEEKNINLQNVVFFTTIRNPFERVLSNYWYNLKFNKLNKISNNLTQQEDFNNFVLNSGHYINFEPKNFRFHQSYNVHVLRLENWSEDFKIFCEKYKLPSHQENCFYEEVKLNTSDRKELLEFNEEVKDYIIKNYHMDFIDGKYDFNPNYNNDK